MEPPFRHKIAQRSTDTGRPKVLLMDETIPRRSQTTENPITPPDHQIGGSRLSMSNGVLPSAEGQGGLERRFLLHEGEGMIQRGTALAATLLLFFLLASCGESDGESTSGQVSETPATKAPEPSQEEPESAEEASREDASAGASDLVQFFSKKTMQLWEAYNAYDLDALKAFYEEGYWEEQEEEVRSNMQPFKDMGVKFTPEETSPPTETAPGEWEVKHTARFSGGAVNMVFIYERFGEDWLLTYAENR